MTTDRLGAVLADGERRGLRFERLLRHPPEAVWRALTESEHLAAWFPADIVGERRAGAELTLPFWPEHVAAYDIEQPVLTGRVLACDPPRLWELTWDSDVLRFELHPDPAGTRLVFTTWLGAQSLDGPAGLAGTAAGYHVCLDALERRLDTGADGSLVDVDVAPLEAAYAELT
ncbi:SRPBCC family protein [Nocardioides ferulae]|uniref:SRPBCC family protein n=1 Tax=Nocardioides ferulae TaxID=2340821 RepID=UPI0013DE5ADA|nr:SRPBCC family protein [Nocardioides ferulae]